MVVDILKDAFLDTVKLLPFLFLMYLIIEYFEYRAAMGSVRATERAGRLGPVIGALCGVVPQCGFSAAAAGLFSRRIITMGTLMAVFLSTSDEMLPIFVSESVRIPVILKILLTKVVIAVITGLIIDLILRIVDRRRGEAAQATESTKSAGGVESVAEASSDTEIKAGTEDRQTEEHRPEEHRGKSRGRIVVSALWHTGQIAFWIFIIYMIVRLLIGMAGEDAFAGFLSGQPVLGVFLAGLVGLIPNCAASVIIAELYLQGLLGAGQMIAGLLVSAGAALPVLFGSNKKVKQSITVLAILYGAGVVWGLIIELTGLTF